MPGGSEALERWLSSVRIFICSIVIKKNVRKRQNTRELSQQAKDKIRDENLNNVILNSHTLNSKTRDIPKPYDVDYSNSGSGNAENINDIKDGKKHIMIQLIERTELSTRKFMLNPQSVIRIGSDIQGNDITVYDMGVSPHQCEIFLAANKIYIRNLSTQNRTIIVRKKESAIVDEKGVRLISNDRIVIGNITYDIRIIN